MGYFYYKCNVCGALIGSGRRQWLDEFRAVYTNGHQWHLPHLSGVGLRRQSGLDLPTVSAPADTDQRYDNLGYEQFATKVQITGMSPLYSEHNLAPPLGDPNNPAENSTWGFLFHALCWELLTKACYPLEVDVSTLNALCRSLPQGGYVVDWGHDYGGIIERPEVVTPGRGGRVISEYRTSGGRLEYFPPADEMYHADPLNIPGLGSLLEKTADVDRSKIYTFSMAFKSRSGGDCFSVLPFELQQMIVCLLPSSDVLNLMLASREFASLPLSQTFWASRFLSGFEFASIFEARLDTKSNKSASRDWNALFIGLKRSSNEFTLQNRIRIWNILQPLVYALSSLSSMRFHGNPVSTRFDPETSHKDTNWRCTSAPAFSPKEIPYKYGCRLLFSRTCTIVRQITGIYVSMVRLARMNYITGLRFVRHNGYVDSIGYILADREECYLAISDATKRSDQPEISGLKLAVGETGIHALAIMSGTGLVSDWAGDPQQIPLMRLLFPSGPSVTLRGDFDGFKLIALAFPDSKTPANNESGGTKEMLSLGDTDPWSPDIPDESLCLNEKLRKIALPRPVIYDYGDDKNGGQPTYRPLQHLHFGGPRGSYLKNIRSLTALVMDSCKCESIEIGYEQGCQSSRIRSLGPFVCSPETKRIAGGVDIDDKFAEAEVTFEIDGPGGEYITAVHVGRFMADDWSRQFFQVNTSYGRSACFPHEKARDTGAQVSTVESSDSTRITGFYSYADGLLDGLGVITETVQTY